MCTYGPGIIGYMGHMGGLINPRPERGQYRAGFSNTGGSLKPQKKLVMHPSKKECPTHGRNVG